MPNSFFHDDASTAPIPARIAILVIAPVAAAAPAAAALALAASKWHREDRINHQAS
jgi:hypothetical protein